MARIAEARAKVLYDLAKSRRENALFSWDLEIEDAAGYPHRAYMDALRAGVKLGLFEEPVWVGVGMTPYAGSARRNREFRLK